MHQILAGLAQIRIDSNAVGVPQVNADDGTISSVITLALMVAGAISTLLLVIGGLRYAMSNGDSSATKTAKDTIIYALVGIVVSFSAAAIVQFVLGTIFNV